MNKSTDFLLAETISPRHFMFETWKYVLIARALGVVAELGIADLVAAEPKDAQQLADHTQMNADALYRLLRLLAAHGVFAEDAQGRFQLTPHAAVLQNDHPESVRALYRLAWQDVVWETFQHLPDSIKTGEAAFDHAFGMSQFEYMAEHLEVNTAYDAAMAMRAEPENAIIAQAYDFGRFKHVVDIGGGRGGLLAAILSIYPAVQGILYDQPQVVAEPIYLQQTNLLPRCDVVGGDFFSYLPQDQEVYTLKRILHDWDDATCIAILKRCRDAMVDEGRIIVIDGIVSAANKPDPVKYMDVMMLALHRGGRERTEDEFQQLFAEAGLKVQSIIPPIAPSTLSILELVRA